MTLASREGRIVLHETESTIAPTEPIRSSRVVTFPESSTTEERLAAIIINRAADGSIRAYTADVPGHPQPDPEIIAMLAQGVALQNL